MLNEAVRPTSIVGVKRLANQMKKAKGISHSEALALAAKAASFQSFALARQSLITDPTSHSGHRLFLTYYWTDHDTRNCGRETLEISLSRPLLDICNRAEMKCVSGLGDMRLVAPDHLVTDIVGQTRDFTRLQLLRAARALRFMEGTGLRPCDHRSARKALDGLSEALPDRDHDTDWYDPASGQYVLIDEPYLDPEVNEERARWAALNGWHLAAAQWPGIYLPGSCSLFVATKAGTDLDFASLMEKIDALAPVSHDWSGISVDNHDVFLSPLARTPQDRRRARAKGLVMPKPSETTSPYWGMWGAARRRPNGAMPVSEHQAIGRIIKAVLRSDATPWPVNRRVEKLRSTLEDWLNYELMGTQLDEKAFFKVYYQDLDEHDPNRDIAQTPDGLVRLLNDVRSRLNHAYPACAPLAMLTARIDTALRFLARATRPA